MTIIEDNNDNNEDNNNNNDNNNSNNDDYSKETNNFTKYTEKLPVLSPCDHKSHHTSNVIF